MLALLHPDISQNNKESHKFTEESCKPEEINNNYREPEQENITQTTESELDLEFDLDSLKVEQEDLSELGNIVIEEDEMTGMSQWGLDTMTTETLSSLVPKGLMTMQPDLPHNISLLQHVQGQNYPQTDILLANQDEENVERFHGDHYEEDSITPTEDEPDMEHDIQLANEDLLNVEHFHSDDLVLRHQGGNSCRRPWHSSGLPLHIKASSECSFLSNNLPSSISIRC